MELLQKGRGKVQNTRHEKKRHSECIRPFCQIFLMLIRGKRHALKLVCVIWRVYNRHHARPGLVSPPLDLRFRRCLQFWHPLHRGNHAPSERSALTDRCPRLVTAYPSAPPARMPPLHPPARSPAPALCRRTLLHEHTRTCARAHIRMHARTHRHARAPTRPHVRIQWTHARVHVRLRRERMRAHACAHMLVVEKRTTIK